ncbi:CobB/CobQ-like glutamine amidotransferase domain-containing protein [Dactylonectria estremocensis]|uniref:Phosphoribosylformylglycinamidine synthase n=1 Tax=Dactylonectria estremocensis TaxID=1079267 RepID=A0A9P9DXF1_9HYPO|nr:CobB/CobQ-like glutamine amidotransferase domain-containing protein [Dactylonectria estremocensis]
MHQVLVGEPCFTASELQKLVQRINDQSTAKVAQLSGSWQYYVDLETEDPAVLVKVKQILQAIDQPTTPTAIENNGKTVEVFIYPRNVSPWSSKASSIALVCGLKTVNRIERGRVVRIEFEEEYKGEELAFKDVVYDRMTEFFGTSPPVLNDMFAHGVRHPLIVVDIFSDERGPLAGLEDHNKKAGLGLDKPNMEYLVKQYTALGRSPNDVELFMFAQVNSEHCRHHVFNASWTIDGESQPNSLFGMIKNTHKKNPDYVISAYSDNAAVMSGEEGNFWAPDYSTGSWKLTKEVVQPLIKVETHNHPTAISPFPGAATGSGGEIRDEGAVGRGSAPKAGLCGFWVSDLLIPGSKQPWEVDIGRPAHYASSLDIMLEAPIGSARFNNEFGRPALTGTFRTLLTNEAESEAPEYRGYHKPIMIAGGIGSVRPQHALKEESHVEDGAHVIVLGGPAMLIGLGGGAASSNQGTEATADLDFDSVQRGNPEMERRAQMVINTCVALGPESPIAFIHDVGAGGLSNALPELVKDAGFGGKFELRQVESADNSMSPLQIWCNEAQERYVLLVNRDGLNRFTSICRRERCGFSVVGTAVSHAENGIAKLVLTDRETTQPPLDPINLPMDVLFPPGRRISKDVQRVQKNLRPFDAVKSMTEQCGSSDLGQMITKATELVFKLPSVGSKSFLITIGDRTVGGLSVRDQLVGPWQTPVADVAVTLTSFSVDEKTRRGEAMAMGEKPTLALISAAASARMAVAESLMNLGAADIKPGPVNGDLKRVKLSANWMAAVGHPGEGAALYEAVQAIGMELCPQLGISIPVGKDSLSMKASWKDKETSESKTVTAPVSLVISAFSLIEDVRSTWTPQLRRVEEVGDSLLIFVDLAQGFKAMGGSALAQCLGQIGNEVPDVRDVDMIRDFFDAMWQLHQENIVLAYHDRSDGGLLTTVAEMMFAGRCGAEISLDNVAESDAKVLDTLFNEELGAVFQIRRSDEIKFKRCFATCGPPPGLIRTIGYVRPTSKQSLTVKYKAKTLVDLDRVEIQQWWSSTSYEMQKLRDEPACAQSEFDSIKDFNDPGLHFKLKFNPADVSLPTMMNLKNLVSRPRVAILREQGVNGHAEMAFAFRAAGFDAVDVHMSDILDGFSLDGFRGLAACGGFSYGDVLGAGNGWAQSILMHNGARKTFETFFQRPDTFSFGVCNGCQMLTRLKELIPGAEAWPTFVENASSQFEGRFSMVTIEDKSDNSVFFSGMSGSSLPIVVSHGEGRAQFTAEGDLPSLNGNGLIPLRYVDNYGKVTEQYPLNPNGSPQGIAGVKSRDGRVVAMMPHPERTIMADVGSWKPEHQLAKWGQYGPWFQLFLNARKWVG